MRKDKITEESIRELVNRFYSKVRTDKRLSPIFLQAIGENDEHWQLHLEKICDFWSSVMLLSLHQKKEK